MLLLLTHDAPPTDPPELHPSLDDSKPWETIVVWEKENENKNKREINNKKEYFFFMIIRLVNIDYIQIREKNGEKQLSIIG